MTGWLLQSIGHPHSDRDKEDDGVADGRDYLSLSGGRRVLGSLYASQPEEAAMGDASDGSFSIEWKIISHLHPSSARMHAQEHGGPCKLAQHGNHVLLEVLPHHLVQGAACSV